MAQPSAGVGRFSLSPQPDRRLPCQRGNPDLWFAEYPTFIEQAKAACMECPVRAECLAGALDRGEAYGVWGGQLVVNGAIVAQKRGRGRPRKAAAA